MTSLDHYLASRQCLWDKASSSGNDFVSISEILQSRCPQSDHRTLHRTLRNDELPAWLQDTNSSPSIDAESNKERCVLRVVWIPHDRRSAVNDVGDGPRPSYSYIQPRTSTGKISSRVPWCWLRCRTIYREARLLFLQASTPRSDMVPGLKLRAHQCYLHCSAAESRHPSGSGILPVHSGLGYYSAPACPNVFHTVLQGDQQSHESCQAANTPDRSAYRTPSFRNSRRATSYRRASLAFGGHEWLLGQTCPRHTESGHYARIGYTCF